MSNERLNSLTSINMHKDVRIDHQEIAMKYLRAPTFPLLQDDQNDPEIDLKIMDDPEVDENEPKQPGIQDFMGMLNEA